LNCTNCTNCGNKLRQKDRFCSHCGHSLTEQAQEINISSGDYSINLGQYNHLTDNTINIATSNIEPKAYIERMTLKPLAVLGSHLKVGWVLFSGIVSLLGSIASIFGFVGSSSTFLFYIAMIASILTASVAGTLLRTRFATIPPFINFESDDRGYIYTSRIEGECPKCTGRLKLRSIGPKGHRQTVVRCTRNPDHLWNFDPTVLGDI
jgi:hypothetical protein